MENELYNSLASKQAVFSIIIPCYNSEEYVDRCIRSCLNSTFTDFELILVNDGSTDNTLSKLESYERNDRRIRIFSKENGGYVSAVNYGLEYVNGTYFMLLGSDDEITPNLFADIYEQIKDVELPDLIGFNAIIKKGEEITRDKNSDFDVVACEYNTCIKEFSQQFPEQSAIFFTRDTAKLFKTEILKDVRYFGKKGMDADGIFSILLAHNAKSFLCVPVVGYVWYLRKDSLSGRKKDYQTQLDRINNWFSFGDVIMQMQPSFVTGREKNYLTNYFYAVVKNTVFTYLAESLNDDIIVKSSVFLKTVYEFFDCEIKAKEQALLIKNPFLWIFYIVPNVIFEKGRKRIKSILR